VENKLWYYNPPKEWMEGLPIGNGRLAAMIWGDENCDVISLNHEWLWTGKNRNRDNIISSDMLEKVRELLKKGEFFKATSLANAFFGGTGGISQLPSRVDSYQPAGDLAFKIQGVKKYLKRELNISNGVSDVNRELLDGYINSCFLAHVNYNNIICRWEGNFSGELFYNRVKDDNVTEKYIVNETGIQYECRFNGGIAYKTAVVIKTDGKVTVDNNKLIISGASQLTAFINIGTEVNGIEKELNKYPALLDREWGDIFNTHVKSFTKLTGDFALDVDIKENQMPTDERVKSVKLGEKDISLPLLYFNYGRYLLISSSICGELPANLQGKWNDNITPPWQCDYHFDINLQMNYWMAESANMSDCVEALIKYIERFIPHAKKAAQNLYGCRGVFLPLQTDAWGKSTPESFGWAVWIGAAPWIAQHFWWHYEYNGDLEFLRHRAYPFFKEVARFYEDYLVEDENGIMQIMPSQSPENKFVGTGIFPVSIGISSAMDVQLAYDALEYAIKSAKILKIDENDIKIWENIKRKLPDFKIGKDGRLLEWDIEREEAEPGHRHLSHLYGLYPSNIFNPSDRPEQYKASIKSLEYRLSQGGGHTGWSRAWVACFYARIGNSELVWEHINELIKSFATDSLLDLHPPRIFQIDGNLGAVAALIESIAQFWAGKLHLLRALPKEWNCGSIRGLKVPGGHTVNIKWSNCKVTEIEVIFGFKEELIIVLEDSSELILKGETGKKIIKVI